MASLQPVPDHRRTGTEDAIEPQSVPDRLRELQSRSDAEIMSAVGSGDERALGELQRRYWPIVSGFARALVDADAAEDVTQETFVRTAAHAAQWRPLGPVRTYLLHIARNIAFNERRQQRSRAATLAAARPGIASRTTPTPGELLEEAEVRSAIMAALDAMPERRRETFALIRFGGLSYAEAAAVMGTSQQTTANQMSAAMSDLRLALAPFTDDTSS